jgi:hypothetical protein
MAAESTTKPSTTTPGFGSVIIINNLICTSITCSKIENIPYNLIFKTKFNDSSILITIIS